MKNLKALILISIFIPSFVLAQTTIETNTETKTNTEINTDTNTETDSDTTVTKTLRDVAEPVIEPVKEVIEPIDDSITEIEKTVEERTEESVDEERQRARESIQSVTESLDEINEESKIVESQVRAEIKRSIDKSILEIRSQTDIEAYELQRVVDEERNNIYKDINETIRNKKLTDSDSVRELKTRVQEAVSNIERNLEERSGVEVNVEENVRSIQNTLLRYEQVIEEKRQLISERDGELLDLDSDGDGLSDYDEKFIYGTNPESAYTVEGELTDSEKIQAGINPTSPDSEPVEYQDPRQDREAVISKIHKVEKVELVEDPETKQKRMRFQGTALPNSFVTVYIFSTPTIVTVKTNERGEWSYTLDKELETGEHEVYVATVDNTGRLLARSEGIPVTQTDEAAALGTFGIGEPTPAQNDFVQENFILIVLSILLVAIIVTLILSGGRKSKLKDVV